MKKLISLLACLGLMLHLKAQPNIVKAEYFFDADPGFGNGTNIPVTPGTDLQVTFTAPMTGHNLFLRTLDAAGKWSITNVVTLYTFTGNGNWDTASNWVNNIPGPILIDPGTEVIINPAGQCFQTDDIINQVGGELMVQAGKSLQLNGDVDNSGIIDGGGTLNLASGNSTFSSSGTITTPLVLTSKQLFLSGNFSSGPISLTGGSKIFLSNYNLSMDTFALTSSPSNFIITNGNGMLNRKIGSTPVLFPVGKDSNSYNPVTVSNLSASNVFDVRVVPGILTRAGIGPITTGAVNTTWIINKETAGSGFIKLTTQWNPADEQPGFNRNSCYIAGVCPPPPNCTDGYDIISPAPAAGTNAYTIIRDSIGNLNLSDSFIVRTNLVTYTFNGNGTWTDPSNWANNLMPPGTINATMQVIINPSGGTCTFQGDITVEPGGKITVLTGKVLLVTGRVIVQQY